jgi:hypothetical protein
VISEYVNPPNAPKISINAPIANKRIILIKIGKNSLIKPFFRVLILLF